MSVLLSYIKYQKPDLCWHFLQLSGSRTNMYFQYKINKIYLAFQIFSLIVFPSFLPLRKIWLKLFLGVVEGALSEYLGKKLVPPHLHGETTYATFSKIFFRGFPYQKKLTKILLGESILRSLRVPKRKLRYSLVSMGNK